MATESLHERARRVDSGINELIEKHARALEDTIRAQAEAELVAAERAIRAGDVQSAIHHRLRADVLMLPLPPES